jgi:uncharacterized membrane protein
VLFFPQMKPEKARTERESQSQSESESENESESVYAEASVDGEDPANLTEEEKTVYKLLQENSPVDLNELKSQSGLSNKKWDLALKGLRNHNLAKVEKKDEGLFVMIV